MKIERGLAGGPLVPFAIGSLKGKGAGALTVVTFGSTGEEGPVCGEKRLFIGKVSNNTHSVDLEIPQDRIRPIFCLLVVSLAFFGLVRLGLGGNHQRGKRKAVRGGEVRSDLHNHG